MKQRVAIFVLVATFSFGASGAESTLAPKPGCAFKTPIVEVRSLDQLPSPIAERILSDKVTPFRRLLRAGQWKTFWVVWLERRDASHSKRIEVFELERDGASQKDYRDVVQGGDPCITTDSMLKADADVAYLLNHLPDPHAHDP